MKSSLATLLLTGAAMAQAAPPPSIAAYVAQLPAVSTDVEQARAAVAAKGKGTAYAQFQDSLRADLGELAALASHRSHVVDSIAKTTDDRVSYFKNEIKRDTALQEKWTETNRQLFALTNAYVQASIGKMSASAATHPRFMARTAQDLQDAAVLVADLQKKAVAVLLAFDKYMDAKGYNQALATGQSAHPYYVQLLEMRALELDKLNDLAMQVRTATETAGRTAQLCARGGNPDC